MPNPNFPLVAGYNLYIGARYVPKFDGTYDETKAYEPLTIISYQGDSFTSKTFVPIGIAPDPTADTDYWAKTGNYNVQIEQYRQQLAALEQTVAELRQVVEGYDAAIQAAVDGVVNKADKSVVVKTTIPTSAWLGAIAPFTATVQVQGVTSTGTVIVGLDGDATSTEYEAQANARIVCSGQADNSLTFRALGARPTVPIPIEVDIFG